MRVFNTKRYSLKKVALVLAIVLLGLYIIVPYFWYRYNNSCSLSDSERTRVAEDFCAASQSIWCPDSFMGYKMEGDADLLSFASSSVESFFDSSRHMHSFIGHPLHAASNSINLTGAKDYRESQMVLDCASRQIDLYRFDAVDPEDRNGSLNNTPVAIEAYQNHKNVNKKITRPEADKIIADYLSTLKMPDDMKYMGLREAARNPLDGVLYYISPYDDCNIDHGYKEECSWVAEYVRQKGDIPFELETVLHRNRKETIKKSWLTVPCTEARMIIVPQRIMVTVSKRTGQIIDFINSYSEDSIYGNQKINKDEAVRLSYEYLNDEAAFFKNYKSVGKYNLTEAKLAYVRPDMLFGRWLPFKRKVQRLSWVLHFTAIRDTQSDDTKQHLDVIVKVDAETGAMNGGDFSIGYALVP